MANGKPPLEDYPRFNVVLPPDSPLARQAAKEELFTGRRLALIGAGFLAGPIGPVVSAIMRPDPMSWAFVASILGGCWLVGGLLLYGGMTWPRWKPNNRILAARLSTLANSLWTWAIVVLLVAFGPALSVAYFAHMPTSPVGLAADRPQLPTEVLNPATIPTSLRLQFNANGDAEEISKANLTWKALNPEENRLVPASGGIFASCTDNSKPYTQRDPLALGADANAAFCAVKSKIWIFILTFEKPVSFKKIRLNAHGADLPDWDNSETTSQFAIVIVHGELKNMVLDIDMTN